MRRDADQRPIKLVCFYNFLSLQMLDEKHVFTQVNIHARSYISYINYCCNCSDRNFYTRVVRLYYNKYARVPACYLCSYFNYYYRGVYAHNVRAM